MVIEHPGLERSSCSLSLCSADELRVISVICLIIMYNNTSQCVLNYIRVDLSLVLKSWINFIDM